MIITLEGDAAADGRTDDFNDEETADRAANMLDWLADEIGNEPTANETGDEPTAGDDINAIGHWSTEYSLEPPLAAKGRPSIQLVFYDVVLGGGASVLLIEVEWLMNLGH